MKLYIIQLIIVLSVYSCNAQLTTVNINTLNYNESCSGKYFKDIDGNFNNFIGSWKGIVNESITFKVELFKYYLPEGKPPLDYSKDIITGKYYLIVNEGESSEQIICSGQNMDKVGFVIIAESNDGTTMKGSIYDTCISKELVSTFGNLSMNLGNKNTAHWGITRKGISLKGMDYVIPTNIILTKQ